MEPKQDACQKPTKNGYVFQHAHGISMDFLVTQWNHRPMTCFMLRVVVIPKGMVENSGNMFGHHWAGNMDNIWIIY